MSAGGHNHAHPENTYAALVVVVAESCIQVAIVSVLGFILARRGVITNSVRKSLNKLNNNVFTPSLLASKIAFSLTPGKLAELWVVPLGFVVITVISIASAYVLGRLFRLKKSQTAFAVACASCPNANSLPVALMQSLAYSIDRQLRWGEDDKRETILGRALSYLVLFSTLGTIYRWAVAAHIMAIEDEQPIKLLDDPEEQHRVQVASPPMVDQPLSPPFEDPQLLDQAAQEAHAQQNDLKQRRAPNRQNTVFSSFPNTPNWRTPAGTPKPGRSEVSSSSDSDSDPDSEQEDELSANRQDEEEEEGWSEGDGLLRTACARPASRSTVRKRTRRCLSQTRRLSHKYVWVPLRKTTKVVKGFLTPPLWSVLLSIFICFIPPVQHFLDILVPVKEALKQAGNCSIPITLLVLGSFMHQEDEPQPKIAVEHARAQHRTRTSLRKSTMPASSGESRTIFVTILARMIVTPALVLPLLYWISLAKNGVGDDPVFVVSAALLIGSPPALTLAQISDAAAPGFERLISKLMLWSYAVMTAPTTLILVVAGLWFDQLDRARDHD